MRDSADTVAMSAFGTGTSLYSKPKAPAGLIFPNKFARDREE